MEPRSVRIILVGDTYVGKTSLVRCLIYEGFQPGEPNTSLNPVTEQINQIETTIVDTNADDNEKLIATLRGISSSESCIVCLVCAAGWMESIDSVKNKWLEIVEENTPTVPIMIIINNKKTDLSKPAPQVEEPEIFEEFEHIHATKKRVEFTILCDASELETVREVFDTAQRLALFPACKLLNLNNPNPDEVEMRPELVTALKHIFRRADVDGDGILNEVELNELQRACFTEGELGIDVMAGLKTLVMNEAPNGVTSKGFNWIGFEYIWKKLLEKGRYETPWVILRHCGFDDNFQLAAAQDGPPDYKPLEEDLVLTDEAVTFLRDLFEGEVSRTGSAALGGLNQEQVLELLDLFHGSHSIFPRGDKSMLGAADESIFRSFEQARLQLSALTSIDPSSSSSTSAPVSLSASETGTDTAKVEANSPISVEAWISFWHLLTMRDSLTVSQALPYLGFGAVPLSQAATRSPKTRSPLHAVPLGYSPLLRIDLIGTPGSGRTHLLRGFLNYPFVPMLTPQQSVSVGIVSISMATAAFKKLPSPVSTTSSIAPPKTAKGKAKVVSKKSSSPPQSDVWQHLPDISYQRSVAWKKGVVMITKHNLDTYMVEEDPSNRMTRTEPDLVLVAFDLNDSIAFERMATRLRALKQHYAHLTFHLVGTKADLVATSSSQQLTSHRVASSAIDLAKELQLAPPTFVSALNNDYANLVPTIHSAMIQGRVYRWKISAISAMGKSLVSTIWPHWRKIAIAVGVGAAVWVGLSQFGYLFPQTRLWLINTRYRIQQSIIDAIGDVWWFIRDNWREISRAAAGTPEILDVKHRPPTLAEPIIPDSEQRLGIQRI